MGELYRAIWQVTRQRQLLLIGLAVLVSALAAAPLKFQQLVINSLVEDTSPARIVWLCLGFVAVVLLSAALKFVMRLGIANLGEWVVRLIRERLYGNYVTDTAAGVAGLPKRGTIVTMLSAEAEMVGAFAGSAIAMPLVQIGTLISVVAFILVQQPWLGVIVLAVVMPQALIVRALQARINARVRERVQLLRAASDRISESDMREIDEAVNEDFRQVYETRRKIFVLKLSSKLALQVISAMGVFSILLLGGLLVLDGRTDVGTVVASLTGLARLEGPWRELIAFFRSASTVRVKYELLVKSLTPRADQVSA
ncbi:MAG: ABC transporter transmembrane domain-containing protein [Pseudomonadota bacterium]